MNKRWIPALIIVGVLCGYISYGLMLWFVDSTDNPTTNVYDLKAENFEEEPEDFYVEDDDAVIAVESNLNKAKITPSTRIVYQYYYTVDDKLVEDECEPPYYLLDMTRQDLENYYSDWQVLTFAQDKVVIRKSINDRHNQGYFIVKIFNDKITVFYNYTNDFELAFEEAVASLAYKEEQKDEYFNEFMTLNKDHYVREVLDVPIELLSDEEYRKLSLGIMVYGNEELISLLENYSS